jgi:hypothetical protein
MTKRISKKQLEANRRNAKKSTGPRTKRGKRISSRNSIKHGLYSRDLIINSPKLKEDPREYTRLLNSLMEEFEPVDDYEEYYVRIIADTLWLSQRALRAETDSIHRRIEDFEKTFPNKQKGKTNKEIQRQKLNIIRTMLIPDSSAGVDTLRYELRCDRQLFRALKHLKNIQSERLNEFLLNRWRAFAEKLCEPGTKSQQE